MRTLVSSSLLAALVSINVGPALAESSLDGAYVALASCPTQARAAGTGPRELTEIVEDKLSTDTVLTLLKEYLEFHEEAQGGVGARAALMPWSDLATHAN